MKNQITGQRISRRKSISNDTVQDLRQIISNSEKRSQLNEFRGILVRWFYDTQSHASSFQNLLKEKEGLDSLSVKIEQWFSIRHSELLKCINFEHILIDDSIESILETYNWALVSEESAQMGILNDEADEKIWWNFAVLVKGTRCNFPSRLDTQYEDKIQEVRDAAYGYYHSKLVEALDAMDAPRLCDVLYYITRIPSSKFLIDVILPKVMDKCSGEFFKNEVTPKFVLLCCLADEAYAATLLNIFLERIDHFVDADTVNAALELAAYNHSFSSYEFLIKGKTKSFISIEGVICSILAIGMKGSQNLLPITALLLNERIQNVLFLKSKADKELSHENSNFIEEWTLFLAPFIYIFFIPLVSESGKDKILTDMLALYKDPFLKLLANHMQPTLSHTKFVRALFQMACDYNQPKAVDALLKHQWIPPDLTKSILRAADMGHQKLFSTILYSLLEPDPKIKCIAGSVPKAFTKTQVLRALPLLGKRFPMEVSKFLGKLSNIPVPICVPINANADAFCKSKSLSGLHLGCARLADVLTKPPPGTSNDFIWNKLTFEGTLRKSAAREKQIMETDCVVCMAPMCLVTESALRDYNASKSILFSPNKFVDPSP